MDVAESGSGDGGRAFASRWEMLANGIGNLALSARAEGTRGGSVRGGYSAEPVRTVYGTTKCDLTVTGLCRCVRWERGVWSLAGAVVGEGWVTLENRV